MTASMVGCVLAFGAMAFYAVLEPLSKTSLQNIPPFTFMTLALLGVLPFALGGAFVFERDVAMASITGKAWGGLVAFVLCNFVGYVCYLYALPRISVINFQLIGLLAPVVGGLLAWVLLGEQVSARQIIGLAIIALGLVVALRGGPVQAAK